MIAQDYIVITLLEEVEVVAMPIMLLHLIQWLENQEMF